MDSIVKKPWGSYQIINQGIDYLVKNIVVQPGGKLSLQSHNHRAEHWVVVNGIAKVTVNNTTKILKSKESIFIPRKSKHRLENNENADLVIIEVQFGAILKEDDIIRYEDIYDRK